MPTKLRNQTEFVIKSKEKIEKHLKSTFFCFSFTVK